MDANVAKYLDLIAWSEGTSRSPLTKCSGYDVIVSGPDGAEVFTDFSYHPFDIIPPARVARAPKLVRQGLHSTASGRYQIIRSTWDELRDQLHLPDFSPASQDAAAVQLLRRVGALALVMADDIPGAINKSCGTWASLPGNNYGQGPHTLSALMSQWDTIKPNGLEVA